MSRRSNGWRKAARQAAYEYPDLIRELEQLRSQSTTPNLSGMPHGSEPGRSTEDAAMRQLSPYKQRRLDAVEYAVNTSSQLSSGPSRVKLIEMVYFLPHNRRYLVQGAAMQIPVSVDLAWRWNSDFLYLVWSKLK